MNALSSLAGLLGVSLVSGVNLYLAVLAIGLAERFQWVSGLPADLHILAHPAVLIAAGLMFLVEFFADKIPFVTLVWDAVHTFVRPVGGALLAVASVGHAHPALQAVAGVVGGSIALGAHGTKMGLRVLAHSSPEPASHSVLSMGEDLTVLGLLALAYSHPYIAIPVLVALLLVIALLLPLVSRTINLLLAGLSGVFMAPVKRPGRHDLPQWVDLAMLERDPPGHGVAMRAFARRVKGVSRLRDGYLVNVDGQWCFLYRAFFRTKVLELESGPVRVDKRMLWRTTIFMRQGKPQIFFVPKDWAQHLGA